MVITRLLVVGLSAEMAFADGGKKTPNVIAATARIINLFMTSPFEGVVLTVESKFWKVL
jgi:hypothetical protein